MTLLTIRIEGGLLSPDFLETIHDQPGQKPADFGLDERRSLVDEITAVWSDVHSYWDAFQRRRARARDGESLTSATREAWVVPLLEALGYRLTFQRRAAEADGRTYPISHRAAPSSEEREGVGPPIHIVAFDQKLGERPPAGRGTMSPHALVQDYLNRSDDLWGIVTNGVILRLLRDSAYFSRPSYIEFDLEGMLEGERLDEFILFYRLAHRTRLPAAAENAGQCLLERYHQATLEQGGRIREGLRTAVEAAILTLANGFLSHPKNGELRRAVANGELSARGYYQELLYLIYRLLFLMVAEERNLLTPSLSPSPLQGEGRGGGGDYYLDHYSITRLRRLAEAPLSGAQRFEDLYLGLRTLFQVLRDERMAPVLGIPALNGELFDVNRMRHLEAAHLNNRDLLEAIRQLSYFTPPTERVPRRVNYAALDVEELGSVYESLLDEYPVILPSPVVGGEGHPCFDFVQGTERKTTGSYYTPRELVKETLDAALDPVIAERLKEAAQTAAHEVRRTPHPTRTTPAADKQRALEALLAIRVCDPACGSGHFLLAAARRIGRALAQVDTGEEEPSPEAVRRWTREAIIHCIYGVDKNPLAVDLCKVALWIEGHAPGKPLTFLDAHIKCGDSLVGVFDLSALDEGIPDEAFSPVAGDDKAIARDLKRRNKLERSGQLSLPFQEQQAALDAAAQAWQAQLVGPEDTPAQVRRKRAAYEALQRREETLRTACDLWTAAFFTPLTGENAAAGAIPTTAALEEYRRQPATADPRLIAHAQALAARNRFFHWPLEFPHVFAPPSASSSDRAGGAGERSGFTVVLGNPPWERIKLQEQEFFAARDQAIAAAPNKAARQRLIEALPQTNPRLAQEFAGAKHAAEAASRFVRASGRFPLTAVGDVNTYALFAELARNLLAPAGRAGIITPTGIATDDTTKEFFGDLITRGALAQIIGFENEAFIFPAVHHSFRFCILAMAGDRVRLPRADFVFFCRYFSQADEPVRHFQLSSHDVALINPNTRTMPVFRTRVDAELTLSIYRRVPVLVKEGAGSGEFNPWGIRFSTMFHMANDSGLFEDEASLEYLPLYEAKMMHQFDHRYATYEGASEANLNAGILPQLSAEQKANPLATVMPRYWVPAAEVDARLKEWTHGWLLGFRDITSAIVERTAIFSLLPRVGVGNNAPLMLLNISAAPLVACLLANLNGLACDYVTRQKIAGTHMNFFFVKQLPIVPPSAYTPADLAFIVPRVLELVYTAWDIKAFADDLWADLSPGPSPARGGELSRELLRAQWEANRAATGGHPWDPPAWAEITAEGCPLPPFKWDEDRRAVLRAELDAYYARLYGLTRKQLRYILDPADLTAGELADILDPREEVADPLDPAGYAARAAASAFPGETFRVLKEKELRQYGEYRTRRLVLEAWERLARELGPVVARNYREEMAGGQKSEVRGQKVAEKGATYQAAAPSRSQSPQTPSADAGQPVPIPPPPQGSRSQRLSRLLTLGRQRTPEAIGELVAALGDEDEQLRWLAALSLQGIGGGTVIATLRAFVDQAPSAVAREEAEKILGKLLEEGKRTAM